MKNLSIFCLIWMMLFVAVPCSDEVMAQEVSTAINISQMEQRVTETHQESCAANCACTCCGQSIVATSLIVYKAKIYGQMLEKSSANYQFSLAQAADAIWQPPKLS